MLKELCTLPSALYRNRRLVKKMAKNDLKSRFAGSYFGTVWAFIQPIVTILVYYFVFGIAMRGGAASGDGKGPPQGTDPQGLRRGYRSAV